MRSGKHKSPDTWREIIGNLNVWKRGTERAPHKPLLLLLVLARVQQGGENAFPFEEIEKPLQDLLREFGPTRKSYHPEFPFWHLQSDGCWILTDADRMKTRTGRFQVTRGELLRNAAVARVPESLWSSLCERPTQIQSLATTLMLEFWPSTLHQAIADAVGLNLEPSLETVSRRQRSPLFRPAVITAYDRQCAVCGYDARLLDVSMGIEAAHIKWHAYGGPDSVDNGLALCSLHHVAFDYGAISLSENLRVLVSQDLRGQADMVREGLLAFRGQPLRLPNGESNEPQHDYTKWHRSHVFKGVRSEETSDLR